MDLLDLFCKISIDPSEYERGLDNASAKTVSFADKLKTGLATASKAGAAAMAAVTAAASALSAVAVKGVTDFASYGDNIDKMSQKMGMSAQAYQEWDAVMQHSGTSIDSLQAGMKTLANAVEKGNDAFERLGITQEQISSMSNEDLFSATITALQNVENETERTYLAGQLLGRGATELGALLNTSAEDTQKMKDRVHELGGVMSDEAVKAAANFQDSLQDFQTSISGIQRGILGGFLPSVTQVMDGLTMIFAGEEGGLDKVREGVDGFIENLSAAVPRVVDVAVKIVSSAGSAIVDNLPAIVAAGADLLAQLSAGVISAVPQLVAVVPGIVGAVVKAVSDNLPTVLAAGGALLLMFKTGIIDKIPEMIDSLPQVVDGFLNFITKNLPAVLDKGAELLERFAFGVLEYIPKLVAQLPAIIKSITKFFTDNGPKILAKGGELLGNLIMGIIGAIPEIAVQLPAVITAIVDALEAGWDLIRNAGKYLLEGLWAGISEKVEWLKTKVSGVVNTIKDWFTGKDGFDEHSPSKWAKTVGQFMLEGLVIGMEDGKGKLMETAADIVDEVKSRFSALADVLDLRQDIGQMEYDLWARTEGKNASDAEKYEKQLELLNNQQTAQIGIVDAAAAAYEAIVGQYGDSSKESLSYQKTLLQEISTYQDLLDKIESVTAAKDNLYKMGTVTVDFADSGVGRASAAMVNAITHSVSETQANFSLNATLVAPDGTQFANYYLPSFIRAAAANGTPIAGQQYA